MVQSVYASPRGDRLLWCLQTPPMPDWLDWALTPFRRRAQWLRQEAWVSRADGSGMREIGAMNGHGFYLTGWTPDGNHVAFVYDRLLYTAPVAE